MYPTVFMRIPVSTVSFKCSCAESVAEVTWRWWFLRRMCRVGGRRVRTTGILQQETRYDIIGELVR